MRAIPPPCCCRARSMALPARVRFPSVAALDVIETKYKQRGKTVEITGSNAPSADLHGKLTGELVGSH
ncbi:hypothetical protein [Streptomyces sp. BSE7-9]|uniref:hypothetical protein n=2 Tax=Streptomyces TaxID=1883 RepID=UPI000FE275BE|nr:hypothetical protein [Streptomyces sp. BSE7-9]